MSLQDLARYWNATHRERHDGYSCDAYMAGPYERFVRAVDVDAPPTTVFRWLCQLKVAPYSYDWIDNGGRRSPRRLTSGAENLEIGQHFLVFALADFDRDHHLTGVALPRAARVFGPMAATYRVTARGTDAGRIVACLDVGAASPTARLRRAALAWGDLVMARKQLLNLARLAEADASRGEQAGRSEDQARSRDTAREQPARHYS